MSHPSDENVASTDWRHLTSPDQPSGSPETAYSPERASSPEPSYSPEPAHSPEPSHSAEQPVYGARPPAHRAESADVSSDTAQIPPVPAMPMAPIPTYPTSAVPMAPIPTYPTSAVPMAPIPTYPTSAVPGAPAPVVPMAPTYDPRLVPQPYSAPPTSGPYGYGMPVMASAIPVPPSRRGRTGTIVLSVLSTVLLLVAGVMTTLFVIQTRQADALQADVNALSTEATSQRDKITTLQRDLDTTTRDLTESRGETDDITTQKKSLAACLTAFYDYFAEANRSGPTSAAARKKNDAIEAPCEEAGKYLAPARP